MEYAHGTYGVIAHRDLDDVQSDLLHSHKLRRLAF